MNPRNIIEPGASVASDPVILVWDNGGVWVGFTYDEYRRARSVIDASVQPKVCPKCDRLVGSAHLGGCPT